MDVIVIEQNDFLLAIDRKKAISKKTGKEYKVDKNSYLRETGTIYKDNPEKMLMVRDSATGKLMFY